MKKFALAIISIIFAIFMCFGTVACTGSETDYDVAGNTYVYDSIEVDGKPSINPIFTDCELIFNLDGTYCMITYSLSSSETYTGYYIQYENKVYLFETEEDAIEGDTSNAVECTVEGKSFKIVDEGYYDIVIIFKKK